MIVEKTFSIIKPDAVQRNLINEISFHIHKAGFNIIAQKKIYLTEQQLDCFYQEHKNKIFFPKLKLFMMSSPVIVQILEGPNAIIGYRKLVGHTDPKKAACGTIRARYGLNKCCNSIHASDSACASKREISFFFN